jgi:hypothetical protein
VTSEGNTTRRSVFLQSSLSVNMCGCTGRDWALWVRGIDRCRFINIKLACVNIFCFLLPCDLCLGCTNSSFCFMSTHLRQNPEGRGDAPPELSSRLCSSCHLCQQWGGWYENGGGGTRSTQRKTSARNNIRTVLPAIYMPIAQYILLLHHQYSNTLYIPLASCHKHYFVMVFL